MDVLEPIFSIPGKFSRKAFQFCLISYKLSVNVEVLGAGLGRDSGGGDCS